MPGICGAFELKFKFFIKFPTQGHMNLVKRVLISPPPRRSHVQMSCMKGSKLHQPFPIKIFNKSRFQILESTFHCSEASA